MNEIEVGSFEAKNRLSALLDQVAKGQRIWITKRGRRVALLSPGNEETPAVEAGLVEQSRRLRRSASKRGPSLKSLIEEGRR